jgi:6-phosphogluconolactonase
MDRITFTASTINKAREIVVITYGENKSNALNEVLYGDYNPQKYPMQLIKPLDGKLLFLTDKAAIGTNQ